MQNNILDAITLVNAFLATPGSSNWNPNVDINGDGIVAQLRCHNTFRPLQPTLSITVFLCVLGSKRELVGLKRYLNKNSCMFKIDKNYVERWENEG
ncbi:MAG: hypothetical protein WCD81_10775 [Candidatus Bathyarchaeia archaeon]